MPVAKGLVVSGHAREALAWQQHWLPQALGALRSTATLVHGESGWGQLEFLLQAAKAWLCEDAAPDAEGHPTRPACGRCAGCRLFDAGNHPDLRVVVPETLQPSLGWDSAETDGAESGGESRKRKPSAEIKVEAIREVVTFSQSTVSRGRAKVVLIHPVERLNTVSANALLKTLEEPPGKVRFLLGSGALADVLPTVRSRCQAWRLPTPDRAPVLQWLTERASGLSAPDASCLWAASGERPLACLELLGMGWTAQGWRELPTQVRQGQAGPWAAWPVPLLIDSLQKLCHDLARQAVGAPPRFFEGAALGAPASDRARALWRLSAWGQELRQARRHAEHPWNAGLKVEALRFQARRAVG